MKFVEHAFPFASSKPLSDVIVDVIMDPCDDPGGAVKAPDGATIVLEARRVFGVWRSRHRGVQPRL